MATYRELARPQFDALRAARASVGSSHPIYRCAQLISHLAYRGPDEQVAWYAKTTPAVTTWAELLGINDGMPIPQALGISFRAIQQELDAARRTLSNDAIDSIEMVVADLRSVMKIDVPDEHLEQTNFDWPAIEWVAPPEDSETYSPSDPAMTLRHFPHCRRWFHQDENDWIGNPPVVASDKHMASVPACGDCVDQAERAKLPSSGPRLVAVESLGEVDGSDTPRPLFIDIDITDAKVEGLIRKEQQRLREFLVGSRPENSCALCGRRLPNSLLIAAHIFPRSRLDDAERLAAESVAMLACALGCDALFERGYVLVQPDGKIVAGKPSSDEVARVVKTIVGRNCLAFNANTAPNFFRHASLHL